VGKSIAIHTALNFAWWQTAYKDGGMEKKYLDITKQELLDVMELMHDALTINTDQELQSLLLRIRKLVPCEYIITLLGQTGPSGTLQGVTKLLKINYSNKWLAHYLENGYATVDPVLMSHFTHFTPQLWSQTYQQATTQREQQFVEHATSFGLSNGITVGQRSKRNYTGSLFSFGGADMGEHPRHWDLLVQLTPHIHLALMRTAFAVSDLPALSVREQEVLQWMMQGKTNWETSRILGITERTVKFHVQNILAKLNSTSRGHAIAQAIGQGLVGVSSSTLETWLSLLGSGVGISSSPGSPPLIRRQLAVTS
jgi:DNA-binding CsgD family transcriptional regulator